MAPISSDSNGNEGSLRDSGWPGRFVPPRPADDVGATRIANIENRYPPGGERDRSACNAHFGWAPASLQFGLRSLFWLAFLIALTLGVSEWMAVFPRAGIVAALAWIVAINSS